MSKNYNLKFTVLAENHEACGLECEHGLSIYMEYNGRNYLLDAGQSGIFARNAEKLGIDLEAVEAAFLSHAHYDHGDGFAEFFQVNSRAVVYAREEGKRQDCYSVKGKPAYTARYIGIAEHILRKFPERFCWVSGKKEIAAGVWLIPHSTPNLEKIGQKTGMYRLVSEKTVDKANRKEGFLWKEAPEKRVLVDQRTGQVLVPDQFDHEQSLVIETDHGLVVFNSCSHGGVANIVDEVRRTLPGRQIYAYVGGFHLKAPGQTDAMNCTEQEVEELGKDLLELGIEKIYTGHCTGERGYEVLKRVMGEKLAVLGTGLQVKF